jgi:hypothetical protein
VKKTISILLVSAIFVACGDDDGNGSDNGNGGVEIAGRFTSAFSTETIDDDTWTQDFGSGDTVYAVVEFDNADNVVILQNPSDADFNPDLFSRVVYTQPASDGSFFYCFVVFDAATADDARNSTATADDTDPATTGCGGTFPWTQLTPS